MRRKEDAFFCIPCKYRGGVRMSIRDLRRRAQAKAADEKKTYSHRRARPVLAALSLPEDVSEDGVRVILLGGGRALIENHLGVADVGQEAIRLVTRAGLLTVQGKELELTDVREGALAVSGQIGSVLLPAGGREAAHD